MPESPDQTEELWLPPQPHIAAIINPNSRLRSAARAAVDEYIEMGYLDECDVLETVQDKDKTAILTQEHPARDDYDAVAVFTGDGTLNTVANAKLTSDIQQVREMPIYAGKLGMASDGRHMTFGKGWELGHPLGGLAVVSITPLDVTFQQLGQSEARTVASLLYNTYGFTPRACKLLNGDAHRQSRLHDFGAKKARELMTIAQALATTKSFEVIDADGTPRRLSERAFINGNRMATMNIYPGKLHKPAFYEVRIGRRLNILPTLGRVALRSMVSEKPSTALEPHDDEVKFVINPILFDTNRPDSKLRQGNERVLGEIDGEEFELEDGTTITVEPAPIHRRVNMVALRLHTISH